MILSIFACPAVNYFAKYHMTKLLKLLINLQNTKLSEPSYADFIPPTLTFKYCPKCGNESLKPNNIKSFICSTCGFVYYFNPVSAVAGIIENNNKILFTVRKKEPAAGKLDLPGGFVDFNESAEQALKRELKEELNVELTLCKYITTIPNIYNYKNFRYDTLDMFFYCNIKTTNSIIPDDDVLDYKFIPLESLNVEKNIGLDSIKKFFISVCQK